MPSSFSPGTRWALLGLVLLLVACGASRSLKPGESRVVRALGDAGLRSQAGPGLYIGVSHACADESEARRDAELQARQAIISSLHSQVESSVLQRVTLDGRPAQILEASVEQEAQVRALSRNLVSVQAEAWYIETRERATDRGLQVEVQAWCRMRYDRADHQRLLQELLDELGPAIEEGGRSAGLALAGSRVGEGLRLAGRAWRQLKALDRYEGWTPAQLKRREDLRQGVEEALGRFTIHVALETRLDKQPVVSGFGPALARALRRQLPVTILEGAAVAQASGALLTGTLDLTTRTVAGGLVSCTGRLETTLQTLAGGEVLWRAVEPGGGLTDLREAGGNAEWAVRRLLESKMLLESLPESLATGLRQRLLEQM